MENPAEERANYSSDMVPWPWGMGKGPKIGVWGSDMLGKQFANWKITIFKFGKSVIFYR